MDAPEEVVVIDHLPAATHIMWWPDGSFAIAHRTNSQPAAYATPAERVRAARAIVDGLLADASWVGPLAHVPDEAELARGD